jgi:hypothetical protein
MKAALGVLALAVLEQMGNAKAENGWVFILSDWQESERKQVNDCVTWWDETKGLSGKVSKLR